MVSAKYDSSQKAIPAVLAEHAAAGEGVRGVSPTGTGVLGTSDSGVAVWGGSKSSSGVGGMSTSGIGVHGVSKSGPGVRGDAENGDGVFGFSKARTGVHGQTETGVGVFGESTEFQGVSGKSIKNAGVVGESDNLHGVFGNCKNPHGAGVYGTNAVGGHGVEGYSKTGRGVWGHSDTEGGVVGETKSPIVAAVAGFNNNPEGTGAAIYGQKAGTKGHAGFFVGDVHVTGHLSSDIDISCTNADCAEEFDIYESESIEPGTVMVLSEEGTLHQSFQAYDKRVAGVISGAGEYKSGIILDKRPSTNCRKPIALLGKAFCKVDASYAPVEVGDLLTSSANPGYAMKVTDPRQAFGAVIGKALSSFQEGQGLIPILIALQ